MRGLLVLPETLVLDRAQMADLMERAMRNATSIAARSLPPKRPRGAGCRRRA
jgi:hypothetical protein